MAEDVATCDGDRSVPGQANEMATAREKAPLADYQQKFESNVQLNVGTEDEMVLLNGYRKSKVKSAVMLVLCVCTAGLLYLVFYWLKHWRLWATHEVCALEQAEKVLLKDVYDRYYVEIVKMATVNRRHEKAIVFRYFANRKLKYVWNFETCQFKLLKGLETGHVCSYFHDNNEGLSLEDHELGKLEYGHNLIEIRVKPVIRLLVEEALNPFYVFLLFSSIIWFLIDYWLYAGCIILMAVVSILVATYEARKTAVKLRSTMQQADPVNVLRGSQTLNISSDDLVPGDVIIIPSKGCPMHCDVVLLSGNCIVNESMLTGESVPVTKTPLANTKAELYTPETHKRHTIFCGTTVIQTRCFGDERVLAVVVRTGFLTAKGDLVRSILHPKPLDMRFYRDTFYFLLFALFMGVFGMVYLGTFYTIHGVEASVVILRLVAVLTYTFPPSLPATMTIGNVYAQQRLLKKKIYCLSSKFINLCGTLNVICFDKTGTLTNDGLDFWGMLARDDRTKSFCNVDNHPKQLPEGPLKHCMATCHSLTLIDGKISGYPVDVKMFEAIDWELLEPDSESPKFGMLVPAIVKPKIPDLVPNNTEIAVLRQFTFSSSLQRQSVITRKLYSNQFELYVKGSPEKIKSLCIPDTLPSSFDEELMSYTSDGFRVLALAWRPIPASYSWSDLQSIERDELEVELNFLGLLIMQNSLKVETIPALNQLHYAHIRTVMVTGDNLLTALSVGRDCGMIKEHENVVIVETEFCNDGTEMEVMYKLAKDFHRTERKANLIESLHEESLRHDTVASEEGTDFYVSPESMESIKDEDINLEDAEEWETTSYRFAIEGKHFGNILEHQPDLLQPIIQRGTIFARMLPDQKVQLVEGLQSLGYYVGMCGDGANDCGALKVAHTGVSLSVAEASVAAPFTSAEENISCMPTVMREGRCALFTSFGVFKHLLGSYMSFSVGVSFLVSIACDFNEVQYIWLDVPVIIFIAILFGNIGAYKYLVARPPPRYLTSFTQMFSMVSFIAIQIIFFTITWFFVKAQPWYLPWLYEHKGAQLDFRGAENNFFYHVASGAFITSGVMFCRGPPYRDFIFTNKLYILYLSLLTGAMLWLMIGAPPPLAEFFGVIYFDLKFTLIMLGIMFADFLVCLLWEDRVVNTLVFKKIMPAIRKRRGLKFKYQEIEKELVANSNWPSIYHKDCFPVVRMPEKAREGDKHTFQWQVSYDHPIAGKSYEEGLSKDEGKQPSKDNSEDGANSGYGTFEVGCRKSNENSSKIEETTML